MILKIKCFWPILKIAPKWSNQKIFSLKSYYFCITNTEIVQNSKSKPKKFSFLCTIKVLSSHKRGGGVKKCTLPFLPTQSPMFFGRLKGTQA
jgi:hypothetical protein